MPDRTRAPALGRLMVLLAYCLLGALIVVRATQVRGLEALTCEPLIAILTVGSHHTMAVGDVVYFGLQSSAAVGLQITNECSTAVLIIPFLLIMGGVGLRPTVRVSRVVLATLAGIGMLLAVNVIRIGGIGWATYHWGTTDGYRWSHLVIGSLLALAGFALSVLVALRILVRGGDRVAR